MASKYAKGQRVVVLDSPTLMRSQRNNIGHVGIVESPAISSNDYYVVSGLPDMTNCAYSEDELWNAEPVVAEDPDLNRTQPHSAIASSACTCEMHGPTGLLAVGCTCGAIQKEAV